jgi:hypothetical protein
MISAHNYFPFSLTFISLFTPHALFGLTKPGRGKNAGVVAAYRAYSSPNAPRTSRSSRRAGQTYFRRTSSTVQIALGGDARRFGDRVHLEGLLAPRLLDAPPRLLGEDIRTAEDKARVDA